jgi:prepilin-type N-terminal cleavage/methylation domain-containing protein
MRCPQHLLALVNALRCGPIVFVPQLKLKTACTDTRIMLDANPTVHVFRASRERRFTIALSADHGFTIVELALALAVMAILLAVAIPTFLSTGTSANDRGSQQNLNTALVESSTMFQTNGQTFALGTPAQYSLYASLAAASLGSSQKNLTFTTKNSTSPSTVSVYVSAGGNGIVLANRSRTDTCWLAIDNPNAISTAVNNAYLRRPYGNGKAAVASTPSPKTGKAGAQQIDLPTTAGTYYAQITGDAVSTDCSASNPKITGIGARYQLTQSTIPH